MRLRTLKNSTFCNLGDWLSGRASRLHRGGRRFESVIAHHFILMCAVLFLLTSCGRVGKLERPLEFRGADGITKDL